VKNADFATRAFRPHERLLHQWKDGASSGNGFLEDHAFLGDGYLALYQTTFETRWFEAARLLADAILERFSAREAGGFFDTSDDHEVLIARPRSIQDNATPSANAAAARFLSMMGAYTGEERYAAPARSAVESMQDLMERHPIAFGHWLGTLEFLLAAPREVAIVGKKGRADTEALVRAAFGFFNPNQVVALGDPEEGKSPIPLLAERPMEGGAATAYVCRSFACQAPITDPEKLALELGRG